MTEPEVFTPEMFGEAADHASARHGDFHDRPDIQPGVEVPLYAPQGMGLVSLGEHGRMPGVPMVRPKSWTLGRPNNVPPRVIVIHYTAGSESATAAEDGVAYDQRRTDGTSAHFYTDRNSVIQCVDGDDRSHTALYNGNRIGIHVEQCGTIQTRAQWLDAASRPTIRNTAKVCAWAMKQYNIPLTRLVGAQVRTGRGLCGHVDITNGFPEDRGTHTDPGAAYPWDVLFADIRAELGDTSTGEDDDMTPAQETLLRQAAADAKRAKDLLEVTAHGGRNAIARIEEAFGKFLTDFKALVADRDADETAYLARLDEFDAELAEVKESVKAVPGSDPEALASFIADFLGEDLSRATADAVIAELNSRLAS